ncbi:MAG: 50S ribosomal protein L25/general stress protein Ctc [Candidatus Pelagibacter bacterium]|jgi:large subunit ribosomal protein L25|nr:50S ribosomal protein L25/general stress protein Ctc [Candidatus Pelagibacter bacterium]MDA7750698.1 50S ribosomal protein L25/general stress protein Ctc [Candidatus Pelagibacter sp.]MDA7840794.1 50S ribosomal protein L25/general stress protein Ctc [Candidatus Pelagibacter sp.]MDB2354343.1 50S ribosomal protein L25/general stress protein Ctc [Candidatus Pelagibacter bacterium]MDC0601214.1 50S ribosomal protein L25/general stress protein Ctc [Candidatus Pelagibacter sp.]|tara:strand:- start:1325 stop:2023 length:699 start_codon:yes stop_codon:yes gene_type:complete
MNSLDANTRDSKSKGDVRSLRLAGNIPGIVYGGPEQNQKITVLKKTVKSLLDKGSFLSNIITLNLDGKPQNVLPREISYNVLSDEPTHIDFLRIVPGVKIRIEVPVEFINHETSPGLKRGGVLNIVRRKIELKCPSEKIPSVITLDLDGVDIGESFKISAVKLEEGVTPTITGRDFVIATLAAPTVMKEPEKPAEEAAAEEGAAEEGKEAAPAAADGDKKDGDDKKASEEKK